MAAAATSQNSALAREDPRLNEVIMDAPQLHTASPQAATRFPGPAQRSELFAISLRR